MTTPIEQTLRRALETIAAHPVNDIITAETWRLIVEDMQTLAKAALSNKEAGEAALAGAWEKGREAGRAIAARHWQRILGYSPDKPMDDLVAQGYGNGALNIEHAIRALRNPYSVPAVNGTDEPANAGVREDAGRTALPRAWMKGHMTPGSPDGPPEYNVECYYGSDPPDHSPGWQPLFDAAALREAGGRGDHVERLIGWLGTMIDEAKALKINAAGHAVTRLDANIRFARRLIVALESGTPFNMAALQANEERA